MDKEGGARIKPIQPAFQAADPEAPSRVLQHGKHGALGKAPPARRIVGEQVEPVPAPVQLVDTAVRPDPEQTGRVLEQRIDFFVGQREWPPGVGRWTEKLFSPAFIATKPPPQVPANTVSSYAAWIA